MKIQGDTYQIEFIKDENKLIFSGNLRLQSVDSYDEIVDFAISRAMDSDKTLIIDLTRLEIINSSGIASMGLFLVKLRETDPAKCIKMLASKYIYWHSATLKDLKELNNNLEIEYVVHH